MNDDEKTRKQLHYELTGLRSENALLRKSIAGNMSADIAEDITERQKVEKTLTVTEAKHQELVQHANSMIISMDPDGRVLFFNEFAQKFFGFSEEEILGRSVVGTIVPEEESSGRDLDSMMKDIRTNPQKYINNENENIRRNGERVWVAWTNRAIRDASGNVTEILCIGNDITEHKRLESLLSESEERYRRLFETAQDGIMLLEKNGGHITHANPAALKMLGYSSEECLGKRLQDIGVMLEQGDFPTIMRKLNENGILNYTDVPVQTKSGQAIETDIYLVDRARLAQCNIRDITERNVLEDQLRHSQKMEAIGLLAGGIAHDFNNILSAIVGYSGIMNLKMRQDDPLRANLEQILAAADRATHLTHSLLTFSRKQVINAKPVDMNEVVQQVKRLLERIMGEDIELKTSRTENPLVVNADAGQIEQVIMNLATNARDAMPSGGYFTIETSAITLGDAFIRLHGYGVPGSYALVAVTDTGLGISAEAQKNIFDPFFTTKAEEKGTGLGLSIVYRIIKQHNGYINFYSEPGKGSTFRIYLPLIASGSEETGVHLATSPEELPRGTETILVAEDSETIRGLFQTIFEEYGYQIILAEDGEDAIQKFAEHKDKIRMAVLDMIMPRKSGQEVYEAIKKMRPEIKVIFVSGYTADKIHQEVILEEGLTLIQKPFTPRELLKKVRATLDA
ncbi:MAG: PAS domain S-box protein [Syntrophaceae bacterium]